MTSAETAKRRAYFDVLTCTSTWGLGFIATRYLLSGAMPFQAMFWRFFLALTLAATYLIFQSSKARVTMLKAIEESWRPSFVPGACLGLILACQTLGLKTTSVANNSFITVLYIVFVPILQALFFKQRLPVQFWGFVVIALWGASWMCGISIEKWTVATGDLWTLACAILCAVHIVWTGMVAGKVGSAFWFNVVQTFWAVMVLLPMALVFEGTLIFPKVDGYVIGGLVFLSTFSTLIAFTLQVRAQRVLDASVASMLFLLESPFATFFAFVILGETMSAGQMIGAALTLIACLGVVRLEARKSSRR